jgi:hypothetical protein
MVTNLFFDWFFSKVSKPINATEDYFKAHAKTIKYIVLGLLGAGILFEFNPDKCTYWASNLQTHC